MDDLISQARALLDAGKKLEAIKVYRQFCGATLLDAKNAVEALQRGESLPNDTSQAFVQSDNPTFDEELRDLLDQGMKLQAVKLYKDRTGRSLLDSKRYVEGLGAATRQPVSPTDNSPSRDLPPQASQANVGELVDLLRQRKKLQAVKVYRDSTGASLMEAKRVIEDLESKHGLR